MNKNTNMIWVAIVFLAIGLIVGFLITSGVNKTGDAVRGTFTSNEKELSNKNNVDEVAYANARDTVNAELKKNGIVPSMIPSCTGNCEYFALNAGIECLIGGGPEAGCMCGTILFYNGCISGCPGNNPQWSSSYWCQQSE